MLLAMSSWNDVARSAQIEYLRALAESPAAETFRVGDGFAIATGIGSNTENGVVAGDATASEVDGTIAWFQQRDLPAMWLDAKPSLRDRLLAAGCRPDRGGVDMGGDLAALDLPPPLPPGEVELTVARDDGTFQQVLALMSGHDLLDGETEVARARQVFGSLGFDEDAPLQHYLALERGTAVAMATAFFGGEAVLLQHVVVARERRRRGLGRTLALARLHEARRRGCRFAVLGPTPESRRLYEPLGFTVTATRDDSLLYLPLEPR
jgi:GNAT superfamily N-acetyltransferase